MPRDLAMSTPAQTAGNGGVPYLAIDPAREVAALRTTRTAAFSGAAPATFPRTGAQVEVAVNCTGGGRSVPASSHVKLSVLASADLAEGVHIEYFAANSTLRVDHRSANKVHCVC